jgi:ribonuclease R
MGTIPTRDEILKFIADRPGETTKRDIAKAFNIKGAGRIPLKRLLREMSAEGLLKGSRKSGMRGQGDLPNVLVVQVTSRNKEGYLVARARHEGKLLDGPQDPIIEIDDSAPRNRRHRPLPPVSPGDTALARLRRVDKDTYIARVIRKLGDAGGQIIGVVSERNDGLWLIPADRRERYDYQLEKDTKAAHGDLLICEKLPGPRMGTKRAKLKENIGAAGDPHAFSLISIAEQGLPTVFSDAVIAEAEAMTEADAAGREDLTALPFITIDPADARDHDDAVFAEPDPDNEGCYIVWVAIADVAAYVKPASEMDVEARKRGNSVYMPDRVVPMLPERLSNDLCSLRENETRPCMAVRIQIAANGQKTGHQFYRGLMRSVAKLSYAEAQHAFDGDCLPAFVHLNDTVLQPLWQAYQCMVEAREQRQPLQINRPERRIEMDDKGKITRIYIQPSLEAHKLIEEMMVTANVCAAETLEKAQRPVIYRVHDTPPDDRVRALSDFLGSMNVKLSLGQTLLPKLFNGLMEQAADQPYAPTISEAVLRTQAQAVYTIENIGHFGLNLGRYAHFTSPIRRYADLTVHRALIAALKAGKDGQTDAEAEALPDIAEAISQTERRAMLAERSASERYLSAHMSRQIGDSFSARISGVSRAGLFVTLDDSGADGLIPISQLGDERFYADESNMFMTGGTSGISFRIGESVEVELEEATPLKGGLLFSLVDGGTYGGKQKRGPKKRGAFRRPPRHRPRGRR